MTAKSLKFKDEFEIDGKPRVNHMDVFKSQHGHVNFTIMVGKSLEDGIKKKSRFRLDRNGAYLLMLYLQAHLVE